MARHRVEYTIHERERKPVRNRRGIEFVVIDAYTDFPVFLGDDDDGA